MDSERRWRGLPYFILSLGLAYVLVGFKMPAPTGEFHTVEFARLPVLHGGRIKPMDTLARSTLLMLRGKQSVRYENRSIPAREWLLDVLFRPDQADRYNVFEINDPDVLGMMGIEQSKRRHYSLDELRPHLSAIEQQAAQAEAMKPEHRARYQTSILNLYHRITLYRKLQHSLQIPGENNIEARYRRFAEKLAPSLLAHTQPGRGQSMRITQETMQEVSALRIIDEVSEFYPLPGKDHAKPEDWKTLSRGVVDTVTGQPLHPGALNYAAMGDAWRAGDAAVFNAAVDRHIALIERMVPGEMAHGRHEFLFNHSEPFYRSLVLYTLVFLLAVFSWLFWPKTLGQSAWLLMLLTFTVHTVGLVARMVLQGRPPVTNLYSSAIFVGWAAVLLGIFIERIYRNGVGSAMASIIGFLTLVIAHHLAQQGDTMEMMRAVLDSNFWLATHVVTITIGYSSTFLSGFFGIVYLVRRLLDRTWNDQKAADLERMVYGVVCFSTVLTFVGTILGGIWADQSWGRFWGWDPKENGALMIFLWNVLILHARIGKFAGQKAVMVMAIFGNVITALSWFGVNMLGIGLHSYGFMDKAFVWLSLFVVSQLLIMGLGFFPDRRHKPS